ncbi:MAG: dTDP-4-dehydrorhamnose reductase, partial [Anaerolineaceae bacterium]|nr:dTDP-4-dehydrorhamnose reductase [Anaerolineaceae bacterium]
MGKILLFGTQGQLGWELQRSLAPLGQVVGLDYPQIDLSKDQSVLPLVMDIKPDLIINAAAYTNVDKAEKEADKARAINVLAVAEMARAASKLGIGLIHYSTDYVFDGAKGSLYTETDDPHPLSVYGATKLDGEEAVIQEAKWYWIFRTSWVYSNRTGGFVNKVMEWAHSQKVMRVVSDQVGNPTWCRMLAGATTCVLSMAKGDYNNWIRETTGRYHLAGGGWTSRYEWARAILELDPDRSKQVVEEILPAQTSDFPTPAQ